VVAALDALRQRDLLRRREQGVAADAVHQQRQRVGRAGQRRPLGPRGLDRREQLDVASLELGVDGGKLLLVEVVLERERLEDALLEGAALLRFVQNGLDWCLMQGRAQFRSLPSVRRGAGDANG